MSDIFVYRNETAQYRVWPPVFVSSAPSTILFRNFTDHDATITINLPASVPARHAKAPKKAAHQRKRTLELVVPAQGTRNYSVEADVPDGVYTYQVAVGSFHAVGGSEPRIIID